MRKNLPAAIALLLVAAAAGAQTIRCESNDVKYEKYHQCRTNGAERVMLTRQLSDMVCIEGTTWGTRSGMVWVGSGCGAEFEATNDSASVSGTHLVCESINGRRMDCPASTSFGVSLLHQISDSSCIRGTSWGYGPDGVWVDRGCRAEFVLESSR
ncbi:MAG TPA: DUF3011 domain-containing protein [Thermoanaerobaculia bacterium]|nr:DUF3011 domain-containing protein [Thermoanaerobaculia bacterium]